jgi:hypothetical protein
MRIASDIRGASERFDGFVVLHGTGAFKTRATGPSPFAQSNPSDEFKAETGR